jgi:hypothetical protein
VLVFDMVDALSKMGRPSSPHRIVARVREELLFLKEKEQKNFMRRRRIGPGHGLDLGRGGEIKVFWFFSSEKNILDDCLDDKTH